MDGEGGKVEILMNYYSLTVKEDWRIIFRFENQEAYDID